MYGTQGEGLLYKPTCGRCRPVQRAFVSQRSRHAQRPSLVRKALSEQNAQPTQHTTVAHKQSCSQPVYHLAVDSSSTTSKLDAAKANSPVPLTAFAALAGVALAALAIKKVFDTPSRAYKENVGQEYDSWTDDGVLEYYWGEHIHLGYYTGMFQVYRLLFQTHNSWCLRAVADIMMQHWTGPFLCKHPALCRQNRTHVV